MIRQFFKILWNNRKRNILVFIELFMISLILTNMVLYLTNLYEIYRIKNCYHTDNVVLIQITKKADEDKKISEASFENLKKVLASNPFVESVSVSSNALPYNYNAWSTEFKHDSDRIGIDIRFTDINYGKVMKIKPLKGRWFDASDFGKAVIPVLISKDVDERYFKGSSVGARLTNETKEYEVIGVTERFKRSDVESPDRFTFIFKDSIKPDADWSTAFLVRTSENRAADMLAVAERQVYSTINPDNWTISSLNSLENMHAEQNRNSYQGSFLTVIITIFIIVNIFLGTIGILWYNTNLRIHEIGIRRAIGATGKKIRQQLIMESMVLAFISLAIVVSIMAQTPMFIGRGNPEPGVKLYSILISSAIMIILVLLSTWIPARLASGIQPASALKTE